MNRTWRFLSVGFLVICAAPVAMPKIAMAQNSPATQPAATTQPSGALFSDDFESGKIDPAIWTQKVMGAATLTVQQEKVAHGKNALMVHYPAGNTRGYAFLIASKLPDAVKGHLFGRAYVMVSPKFPNPHTVLILAGTPNWPIANFLEIGDQNNKFQLSFQQNDTATPPRGETVLHGAAFPAGKWFCLEWEFNDTPDQMTTWIDGEKVDGPLPFAFRTEGNTGLVKGFTNFGIGVRVWGNAGTEPFDVYYDDIALGTSRLGMVK